MKRSSFVKSSVGVAVLGGIVPTSMLRAAAAQTPSLSSSVIGSDTVLLVVQMQGGNDGLNTVIPYTDDSYHRVRPTIRIGENDALRLNDQIALNPNLSGLLELYKEGHVALVNGVGYPNPDRSHFRATEIWETAVPDRYETTGWLGRYLDATAPINLAARNAFEAVTLGDIVPAAMIGRHVDVPAIGTLQSFAYQTGKDSANKNSAASLFDGAKPGASPYLTLIENTARLAIHGGDELRSKISAYQSAVSYPKDSFSQQLELAAHLIGSRVGTRIIFVSIGSFDTHVNQVPQQNRLLKYMGDGLLAFYKDLAAHGNAERVLTMTFSEFGRRVSQNASNGTDHGTAMPLFVIGGQVKGGLYGAYPSITDLDHGDLKYNTDFRDVYATVLDRWLGRTPERVLFGNYQPLAFV